jgi:hypothetical protein
VLAVVDEEVGLRALRQRVLARVGVGRPLRHPLSRAAASYGGRRTGRAPGARRRWTVGAGRAKRGGICVAGEYMRRRRRGGELNRIGETNLRVFILIDTSPSRT